MAKWTKSNNPHTWSRKMARRRTATRSRAIVLRAPSAPNVIRVSAPRPAKRHHRRRHGGGGGHSGVNALMSIALGGAAYGFIEKSFGASIPTIPILGRAGTIAIGMHFLNKGRGSGLIRDIGIAAAVIAGYQLGSLGKISGDIDGDLAPQVGGIAAQV